jgi:hypothetical protein
MSATEWSLGTRTNDSLTWIGTKARSGHTNEELMVARETVKVLASS